MGRREAKELAEKVSLEDLIQMFYNAQNSIKDWTQVSIVNKGMTKGVAFNILSKNIESYEKIHVVARVNMLREFGEYLPNCEKKQKERKQYPAPTHQEPVFLKQRI